ncbi:MAG TPA: TraB/GumN family protein [Allosphingosinicella sp.]|jgi:hypothetical protein
MRRWLRGLAAAVIAAQAALMPAAGAAQAQRAEAPTAEARPALWRLADQDTTIYLFGTMHALPRGVEWGTARVALALAEADELVLEVADTSDSSAMAEAMRSAARGEAVPPIVERVPAERRQDLLDAIAASGLPVQAFDAMKSWTAGLLLALVTMQRIGIQGSSGVEEQLKRGWRDQGREVTGLETAAQQLGFFDELSEESQRLFLLSALEPEAELRRQFEAMLRAWTAGDTDAIARSFNEDISTTPEMREVLLTRRNARWAEWLDQRMDRPGTVFVAVGAGHLAGEGSVQDMLARRGLRAERVQ